MPQSLSNILIHIVFSTKNRQQIIKPKIRSYLYSHLAVTCRNLECEAYRIGGVEDHVHISCRLSRKISISKLVEQIKKSSSKWIKTQDPQYCHFAWQNGYGAFSIGHTQLAALIQYISDQENHHKKISFKEEFVILLKKYGINYDERYLWD